MAIRPLVLASSLGLAAASLFATPVAAQDTDTPEGTVIDAGSGDAVVVPLSPVVASVAPGDAQRIAINWTAMVAEAREFKVTAVGSPGVTVSYPTYPVDGYSSGYWDDTLSVGEIDYTALYLAVDADAPAPRFIDVTVTYVSDTGVEQSDTYTMPFDDSVIAGPDGNGEADEDDQGEDHDDDSDHGDEGGEYDGDSGDEGEDHDDDFDHDDEGEDHDDDSDHDDERRGGGRFWSWC